MYFLYISNRILKHAIENRSVVLLTNVTPIIDKAFLIYFKGIAILWSNFALVNLFVSQLTLKYWQ